MGTWENPGVHVLRIDAQHEPPIRSVKMWVFVSPPCILGRMKRKRGGGGEREKEMRSGTAEPTVVDEPDAPVEIELQALADGEEVEAVVVAAVRQHRRDVREHAVVEERDDLLGVPVLIVLLHIVPTLLIIIVVLPRVRRRPLRVAGDRLRGFALP